MTSGLPGAIAGHVVVVVGGTKGIGAAIAKGLAEDGAAVIVAGRDVGKAEALVQQIATAGGTASAFRCDVASDDDCEALFAFVEQRHGRLDTVFANQGVAGPALDLTEWPESELQTSLDVNLLGCVRLARYAESMLAADEGGRMIVTGSGSGHSNGRGLGMYGISKAAVAHLVRQLAIEWRPKSIAVNELIPGPVRTAMTGFDGEETDESNPIETFAQRRGEWMKNPDDVVPLARLLAGQPTNGPSGQIFSLAGRVL